MKNSLLLFFLFPLFSLSQTYNVQTTDALGNINTIKVTKESNPYENIKVIKPYDNDEINKQANAFSNSIKAAAANGAFLTASQKAKDLVSLKETNLNKFKYIVVANISAAKAKEVPKIRKVLTEELFKTNFKIVQNLDKLPEDLLENDDLALYLYLNSENENWPFKNVVMSLTDKDGNLIHQRGVRHDRSASFLTRLVLKSIKNHPHKFDINAKSYAQKNNSVIVEISKEDAVKRIKEAKELFDSGILNAEEYEKLIVKYKAIIMGN
jgi:hypothetical protein